MIEIQLRIAELEQRLDKLVHTPKRGQYGRHSETIAQVEGEIMGLRWVLSHCFNQSEPNVIEQ